MTNTDTLFNSIEWNTLDFSGDNISYIKDENGKFCKITYDSNGNASVSYYITESIKFRTVLAKGIVKSTSLIQDTEEKLLDYIYELDGNFIKDNGSYMYNIIRDKAYDISESIFKESIDDYDLMDRDIKDITEEIVSFIDFDSLYDVIDEILSSYKAMTFEEILDEICKDWYTHT